MAKPKQVMLLLRRMAREIGKMLTIKVNAAAFTSACSFDFRLVRYGGYAVNVAGTYSLLHFLQRVVIETFNTEATRTPSHKASFACREGVVEAMNYTYSYFI